MAREERYDLVVLGGGTGGLVSALVAAGAGARVALVEGDRTGGDCLWTGCVPSKSLIAAADLAHRMRHADRLGLTPTDAPVDLAAVMAHVDAARARIAPHDSPERLRREGVEVVEAHGRFTGPRTIEAAGRRLSARAVIIATGSRAVVPPVPGLAEAEPLTNETVWDLRTLPPRLAVVGAGPIGCELGQAFARLGSRVTIVDVAHRVLPREEPSASASVAEALRAEGVDLRLAMHVARVEGRADGSWGLLLEEDAAHPIEVDRVLVAAGRAPRSADLGLEEAGVRVDDGGAIRVDGTMRTSAAGVFAVGDVTGGPAFTHVAAHHARTAAVNALFGLRRRADRAQIPWVTFTDPEVAHVGLTEAAARDRWGDGVVLARAGYDKVDRAIASDRVDGGFALLVGDPRGRLVGATLVGAGAGESIAELTAWIESGAKIDAVSQTVHAYPTYADAAARAADEHLRAKYATPGMRRMTGALLRARRLIPGRASRRGAPSSSR
jgi:pyruvate/2-oxoglutarate dehydrogenase complex dihydrolipoamide dehydrogenase (E3) component